MIILEGPDGGGKSFLAKHLVTRFHIPLVTSEGPAKSKDEINQRILRYLNLPNHTIYDRFPAISERIYGPIFGRPDWVDMGLVESLKHRDPLIIYCRPADGFKLDSQNNPVSDTPEYVAQLHERHKLIVFAYSAWADEANPIIYDWLNTGDILQLVRRHLGRQ